VGGTRLPAFRFHANPPPKVVFAFHENLPSGREILRERGEPIERETPNLVFFIAIPNTSEFSRVIKEQEGIVFFFFPFLLFSPAGCFFSVVFPPEKGKMRFDSTGAIAWSNTKTKSENRQKEERDFLKKSPKNHRDSFRFVVLLERQKTKKLRNPEKKKQKRARERGSFPNQPNRGTSRRAKTEKALIFRSAIMMK